MAYSHLQLKHFRSYRDFTVEFSRGVNIVIGPNGSGKTNLLEAVYVLSQGASFRVEDKALLRFGENQFKLEGEWEGRKRVLLYTLSERSAKVFKLDNLERRRLSFAQKVPVVLFEPEDLRLLSGSPQRRRDYIDNLITRFYPGSNVVRRQYDRALLQRNSILRQAAEQSGRTLEDQFFVWDINLAEHAAQLVQLRLQLLELWNARLSSLYSRIAGKESHIEVMYKGTVDTGDYKANVLRYLTQMRTKDVLRGFTGVGPHREDIDVLLDGSSVSLSASRGEFRSLILALKMIELQFMDQTASSSPILLLDDVFSELDAGRRSSLAELASGHQTVITTTDADAVVRYFPQQHKILSIGP